MSATHLDELKEAARTAWLFALPLVEIATTRSRGAAVGSAMNTFGHMRKLADHRSRAAIYAASFVHAATEFGSRLGRRMHLTRDERTRH